MAQISRSPSDRFTPQSALFTPKHHPLTLQALEFRLTVKFAPANAGAVRPALFALGERFGLAALERILAGVVLNLQRRAFQLEDLAEGALKVAGVAGVYIVQAAAVDHDQRRVAAALMGVAHLGREAPPLRRRLLFQCADQRAGEFRRG